MLHVSGKTHHHNMQGYICCNYPIHWGRSIDQWHFQEQRIRDQRFEFPLTGGQGVVQPCFDIPHRAINGIYFTIALVAVSRKRRVVQECSDARTGIHGLIRC